VAKEYEEGEIEGEECHELRVGGWHAIAFAIHFWKLSAMERKTRNRETKDIRGGRSSLIHLLSRKFRASHPI
jgi:hypothetical protein